MMKIGRFAPLRQCWCVFLTRAKLQDFWPHMPMAALGLAAALATLSSAHAEELAVRDVGNLFSQACVAQLGSREAVEAWARNEKLTRMTNKKGLQLFATNPDGEAWQLVTTDNIYIVAIRQPPGLPSLPPLPPPGCAVYAEHADPVTSACEFSAIVAALPAPLGEGVVLGDQTTAGPHGIKTLRIGTGRYEKKTRTMMMVMTDEHAGGTFQATMQMTRLN